MKQASILNDRNRLAIAIAQGASCSDVIRAFGLEPSKKRIAIVRRLASEYDLSVSHFNSKGSGYGRFRRAELESAAKQSTSVSGMMRRLGMNPRIGSTHGALRSRLVELGIDTSHFVGSKWARLLPSNKKKSPEEILCRKPRGCPKRRTNILRRALSEMGVANACAECGQGPHWNGKPLVLQVDHRDGDNLNDQPDNLRFLCPNCHSQTPTYGFRSQGVNQQRSPAPG